MIDHVSIGVSDLNTSSVFYEKVLSEIGLGKLSEKPGTVGFGKKYPEFWVNHRPGLPLQKDSGVHICLRSRSADAVRSFYKAALDAGATCAGKPDFRSEYSDSYYAAFIFDPDGNKVEVVTFLNNECPL